MSRLHRNLSSRAPTCPVVGNGRRARPGLLVPCPIVTGSSFYSVQFLPGQGRLQLATPEGFCSKFGAPASTVPGSLCAHLSYSSPSKLLLENRNIATASCQCTTACALAKTPRVALEQSPGGGQQFASCPTVYSKAQPPVPSVAAPSPLESHFGQPQTEGSLKRRRALV